MFALSNIFTTPSPAYISHSSVPSSPKVIAPPVEPCMERFVYPVKLAGELSLNPILPLPLITNLFALSVMSRIQNPVLLTPLIPGCISHTLSGVSYVFSNLIEERSFPAFKWRRESGLSSPIPSLPADVMRSFSDPSRKKCI